MSNKYKYTRRIIGLIDHFPLYYRTFKEKYRQRLLIFLFFMVLSFIFWFIRALNEQYEDEITYAVKYTKLPPNKILVGELPDKLKLRVQAKGISIFTHKLSLKIRALRFNIESFALQESGNNSFYVPSSHIKEFITEELENIKIIDISPDTLFFRFTDLVTRKIAVKVNVQYFENILAKQYTFNGDITSEPDSIIVTGPLNILDTLKAILTESIILRNLTDTVIKTFNLNKINQVEYNKKKVKVIIPVDKFTETSVNSSLKLVNVPDSLILKTFPISVKITYRISLSNYEKITPEMLIPFVDYNNIGKTISSMLKVQLTDTPTYIYAIRIDPGSVDYLIEKQ